MKKHLPNFITCLNLSSGCVGIYYTLVIGEPQAIYFVLIGGFFDLIDGLVARLLKVSSEIGKQLDSLADLITFGLLPSFYILGLLKEQDVPFYWLAILVTVFSAIRLAKFNLDETQTDSFRGLPVPANAIMLTSIVFVPFELGPYTILSIVILSCFLLVSNIRLIALKFSSFQWKGNEFRWLLIGGVVVLGIVLGWTFLPLLIPFYVTISLFSNLKNYQSD